jgi:L-lactate dehydrogenase complex protein LldG
MSSARAEILERIRSALTDRPAPEPVARTYRTAGEVPATTEQLIDLLTERIVDYRATVARAAGDDVAQAIAEATAGLSSLAVPDGFPGEWVPAVTVRREPFGIDELDGVDGVLSTCAVAIAETGTIVLDAGPGQGTRAATLVPDFHLVVVRADQIVAGVPDAIARLDPTRPLTWISGPSATSDIELERVEGVHGPRTLHVVIVGQGAGVQAAGDAVNGGSAEPKQTPSPPDFLA